MLIFYSYYQSIAFAIKQKCEQHLINSCQLGFCCLSFLLFARLLPQIGLRSLVALVEPPPLCVWFPARSQSHWISLLKGEGVCEAAQFIHRMENDNNILTAHLPLCVYGVMIFRAHIEQWGVRGDPLQSPYLETSCFSLCDAGLKGRGEGNRSHVLSLCATIHRLVFMHTHMT